LPGGGVFANAFVGDRDREHATADVCREAERPWITCSVGVHDRIRGRLVDGGRDRFHYLFVCANAAGESSRHLAKGCQSGGIGSDGELEARIFRHAI